MKLRASCHRRFHSQQRRETPSGSEHDCVIWPRATTRTPMISLCVRSITPPPSPPSQEADNARLNSEQHLPVRGHAGRVAARGVRHHARRKAPRGREDVGRSPSTESAPPHTRREALRGGPTLGHVGRSRRCRRRRGGRRLRRRQRAPKSRRRRPPRPPSSPSHPPRRRGRGRGGQGHAHLCKLQCNPPRL